MPFASARAICLVAGIATTTNAYASPIERLWESPYAGDCAKTTVFRWQTQLVAGAARTLVIFDAATGKQLRVVRLGSPPPAVKVPSVGWADDDQGPKFAVGDVVLSVDDSGWVAYDGTTGTALWRKDQEAEDGGRLRAQPAAANTVLLLHPGGNRRGTVAELVDAKTGTSRWRAEAGKDMRAWFGSDAERVYVATTPAIGAKIGHLFAYTLAAGKLVYTVELSPPVNPEVTNSEAQTIQNADAELPDVIAIDGSLLVLPVPNEGLRTYDAKTGKQTARIAAPEVRRFGITGLVAAAGRAAFFIRTHDKGPPDAVEVIDIASKKVLWHTNVGLGAWGHLRFDRTGTVIVETDEYVRALDQANGALAAEWGRAGLQLGYARNDATTPQLVVCGDGKLTALDPTGAVVAAETATVDGTLTCPKCSKTRSLAGVKVSIGGVSTTTDKLGRYKLTATGRGVLPIDVDLPSLDDNGSHWKSPDLRVRLTGKKTYHLGNSAFAIVSEGE